MNAAHGQTGTGVQLRRSLLAPAAEPGGRVVR